LKAFVPLGVDKLLLFQLTDVFPNSSYSIR